MISPTYGVLNQLLTELGYTSTTVPGSHILFERSEPPHRIVLRVYQQSGDPFDLAELAYVRQTLDVRGILDKDEFDEAVRERSKAG